MAEMYKIRTRNKNVFLRVAKGHFATMHIHTNYYIDVTTQKTRLSEAKAVAEQLIHDYRANTIIDTILCLDGTEVIGTCMANELTKDNYINMNAHQTIYVVSPDAIDAINYYGGNVVGVSAIFATVDECDGHAVHSIFDPNDLGDYESYKPHHCPKCKNGEKIEALVNSYGISML